MLDVRPLEGAVGNEDGFGVADELGAFEGVGECSAGVWGADMARSFGACLVESPATTSGVVGWSV